LRCGILIKTYSARSSASRQLKSHTARGGCEPHPPHFGASLQEGIFLLNLPYSNESSATARLAAARSKQWHQQGEALLTIENARSFLNAAGLVLFAPRPQIAAPAPSFVEAVAGARIETPTLAHIAEARNLLARLVAEGLAVPLNLLGVGSVIGQAGETPDFIASAQVFSYIFTLRGDKGWKQPPASSGPGKFSNLAVAAHEALTRRGPLSVYDLTGELGKEVTESAVLRALGELWSHLRVLPLPQPEGGPTVWELATTRLNKQIKAGANAGLPTALSTLISLYLGQAMVAGEDEVESFLSPLAARSRIRDVVHALIAARQLDTVAIDGKTVLHVAGAVPAFLSEEPQVESHGQADPQVASESATAPEPAATEIAAIAEVAGETAAAGGGGEPRPRIAKFVPRQKPGTRDLAKARPAKFARKPFGEARKPFGEKRPFAPRDGKARPPFGDKKTARPFGERPGFKSASESAGERKPRFQSESGPRFEKRRFAPRADDSKPRFGTREREGAKPDRERRPFVRREGGEDRPQRRSFARNESSDRRPRKPFDRSSPDRPARKPFARAEGGDRPLRKPFDRFGERPARKPFDRSGGERPARRPFDRSAEGRAPRRPFDRSGERPVGRKPPFGKPGTFGRAREFGAGDEKPKRDFKTRPFGKTKPFGRRAESGDEAKAGRGGFADRKPFTKPGGFSRPFRPNERSEAGRPRATRPAGAGFGAKKFGGGRKFGGARPGAKPGGAKFGDRKFGAKKPFGKPKGERKPKPSQDDREA
jgi:23S rRNA pseudouridine2605 synthase